MAIEQDLSNCVCVPLGPLDPPPQAKNNINPDLDPTCGILATVAPPDDDDPPVGDPVKPLDPGDWGIEDFGSFETDPFVEIDEELLDTGGFPPDTSPHKPGGPGGGGGGNLTLEDDDSPGGDSGISVNTNSLPGQKIYTNSFLAMSPNVSIPVPISNSNLPKSLQEEESDKELQIPDGNLNFVVLDPKYNIEIDNNLERLNLADNKGKSFVGDANNILSPSYDRALAHVLDGKGGQYFVPWNGIPVSKILVGSQTIENALSEETLKNLEEVSESNVTSLNLRTLLLRGLVHAAIDGTLGQYSFSFFKNIVDLARPFFPTGIPQSTGGVSAKLNTAYSLAISNKISLLPKFYTDGQAQRDCAAFRFACTDLDLCIPITTRDGRQTAIRFRDDDTIEVRGRDGVIKITQVNEFLPTVTRKGVQTFALASNRDRAYILDLYTESMIQGLLGNNQYTIELTANSTTTGGSITNDNVEMSEGGVTIPEAMLYSSKRDTITKVVSTKKSLRTTTVSYGQVWTSDDPTDENFNSTVEKWSNPRATLVIPREDGIWKILLEGGDIQLKLTSFSASFGGITFPRIIFTDVLLVPTDEFSHSSLKGSSKLASFEEGVSISRTINFAISPLSPLQKSKYAVPVLNPTQLGPNGEKDNGAIKFTTALFPGSSTKRFSKNDTPLITSKSIFAIIVDIISNINTNYNLENGSKGKSIPISDITSFLTVNSYLKFLTRVPLSVRFDLFQGFFNGIKVFAVKLVDKEKTFMTAARLIGIDLTATQIQPEVPSEELYFPSIYANKLYRRR